MSKTPAKKAGPRKADAQPGVGHNSGERNPEVIKIVEEILASSERQKAEAKLQRDLRNRAKSEFGILSGPLAHEIKLQKMDGDVRVQYESGHADLKKMLGVQAALDFAGAQPTRASAQMQASEADMKARPGSVEEQQGGFEVQGDIEDAEVIEREG